ncbi:hypothetical protein [Pseudophaeobacter arcticus]|jgi:hypothetical protein|uniref:hypothetical protein n=1 Tax=Pseudophaeobacter arcticus TaxID=385492 RepID=UPI0039E2CFA4
MKHLLRVLIFLPVLALVSACAAPAAQEQMVAVQPAPVSTSNSLNGKIGSPIVTGGQETSPLWTSEISDSGFQTALEESLRQAGLLSSDGSMTLTAQLLDVEQPFGGFDLTVKTTVRYMLKNANGRIVYDKTIRAAHTSTVSDAFAGVKRLRLANEGSARANLALLIQDLKSLGARSSISALTS